MPFEKGKSGNPNGKPAGILSEKTKQWNELKDSIVTIHAERFNSILATLEDEKFIDSYVKILEYFQPKLARTESKTEITTDKSITLNID